MFEVANGVAKPRLLQHLTVMVTVLAKTMMPPPSLKKRRDVDVGIAYIDHLPALVTPILLTCLLFPLLPDICWVVIAKATHLTFSTLEMVKLGRRVRQTWR